MAMSMHILPVVCFLLFGATVYLTSVSANRQSRQVGTSLSTRTLETVSGLQLDQGGSRLPTTPETGEDFHNFIPTTPSPENVNCYIEVPTLQTVGGMCVRFGRSRMWSCQSGVHIQMSNYCERLSRRTDSGRRRTRSPRP